MADLAELEARIRVLEDIEAIKKLKHKYWNSLDKLQWDAVIDCFSQDGAVDYGHDIKLEGKKALVEQLKDKLREHVGVHQGHHPVIELISDTAATGTWELFVYEFFNKKATNIRLAGFYDDEYVKEDGEWKIRKSIMTTIFMETHTR